VVLLQSRSQDISQVLGFNGQRSSSVWIGTTRWNIRDILHISPDNFQQNSVSLINSIRPLGLSFPRAHTRKKVRQMVMTKGMGNNSELPHLCSQAKKCRRVGQFCGRAFSSALVLACAYLRSCDRSTDVAPLLVLGSDGRSA
jgi:hypothetical protein